MFIWFYRSKIRVLSFLMSYQILRLNPGIRLGGKSLHALGHPANHYPNFFVLSSSLVTTQFEMKKIHNIIS